MQIPREQTDEPEQEKKDHMWTCGGNLSSCTYLVLLSLSYLEALKMMKSSRQSKTDKAIEISR